MDEAARLRVVLEAVGARETARDVERVDAGLKKASASAEVTRGATLKLAKSRADLRVQTVAVDKAEVAAADAVKRYGRDSLQARDATARLAVAQQRAAVTADGLATRFKGVSAHTGEGSKRLETLGRAGEKSARQLKTGFVAAGVGAAVGIGSIVKTTVEFDRAMRNVNSIAGLGEKSFQQLSKRVLDLAGPTAQAPKTLAEGLYDLVSSGFKAGESIDILHASAKAATAGLTDTATSTKAVAAVLNAYRLPASQAAKVSDYLFQTVNRGVLSFDELASTIGDVLPFASQLSVGMDQVGAALSTMTKEGINSFEATTRLKDLLQAFLKPSNGMAKAIEATGAASGEALIKHKGLQGALEAIAKTTDGSKTALAGLFPNIRALGGALALTGTNAKAAHGDLKAFSDVAGSTNRAFKEQSKSVAVQWQRATANFKALEIELGTGLVPLLTRAATSITRFVQGMRDGTGAGGRFRRTLEGIWHAAEPVVNFLKDHPKLIGDAVAAWGLYKVASLAALGGIKIGKIRAFFARTIPVAGEEGAAAGAAYAASFDTASAAGVGKLGTSGKIVGAFRGLGQAVGVVFALEIGAQIEQALVSQIPKIEANLPGIGHVGFQGQSTAGDVAFGGSIGNNIVGPAIKQHAPGRLKSPALPTGPVKTPRAPSIIPGSTSSTNVVLGDTAPGGTSSKQASADAAQKRRDAADKARQAAADARQRAEDARQMRLSMIDALAAFRSAGTSDPLRQNRIQQRADRQKLALATSPLERLQDRTDLRGLKRDAQGLRVQGKQDDIQFALDMGRITNDVAANRLKGLAHLVHGNKELKRSLLTQARSLRGQDDTSGSFDLNVGDVVGPTVYEVRRDRTARMSASTPHVLSTASQPTTVHTGDVNININGSDKTAKEIAQEVAAYFRHQNRTHGAAVRRARAKANA